MNVPRLAGDVNWLFLHPSRGICSTDFFHCPFAADVGMTQGLFWECMTLQIMAREVYQNFPERRKAREVYHTFLPGAGVAEANGASLNETITKGVNLVVIFNQLCCSLPCPRVPCRLTGCHTPSRGSAPAAPKPCHQGCHTLQVWLLPPGRAQWGPLGGIGRFVEMLQPPWHSSSSCMDPVQPDTHWAPLVSPFLQGILL